MSESIPPPEPILADAWARLHAGQADGGHAFRTAALATADALGRPDVRTVVLRHVDAAHRTIDFQTDRRSPKFAGLGHGGMAAWLFYDRAARLQLRIHTTIALHTRDAIADAQWDAVPTAGRLAYCAAEAPGALRTSSDVPPAAVASDETASPVPDGRVNFVVVRGSIDSLEWLRLIDGTWRRVRFTWPNGMPAWQWLAP